MSLSAAERFFSLLALLAGAGAIGLVVLRLVPGGRPTLAMLATAGRWLAFLVTGTATAGSLYFSEIQEFTPCRLCWFQRIFMFSLAVITFERRPTLELAYRVPWDDEHTLGARVLDGVLLELCGSI